jgi:NAD(P)-dependent dehydrogenase (short-subunit alcohol dehydrogenase family)
VCNNVDLVRACGCRFLPLPLAGKVALVTGGSSGIGRASALTFAREGAKVMVADVVVGGGEETVGMIKKAGGEASFVKVDVSKAAEVEAMVKKAVATYGGLECAFNNAGIAGEVGPTAECTEENWERILAINLKGVWLCMKYEIAQMLKQGGGSIVNTASQLGLVGCEEQPAYVASKHGVVGLTKTAALEYAKSGIRVNAVCPGPTDTPIIERILSQQPQIAKQIMERVMAREPMGRIGRAEELGEAVVWLSSEAASFVTGHTMVVDGGYVAQ